MKQRVCGLSAGEAAHSGGAEVEGLLEVVEADHGVDFVPVVDLGFRVGVGGHWEVQLLVEEEVEQKKEKTAVGEFFREFLYTRVAVFGEYFVNEGFKFCPILLFDEF